MDDDPDRTTTPDPAGPGATDRPAAAVAPDPDPVRPQAPAVVRGLSWLLVVEIATAGLLTAFALVSALVGGAAGNDWSGLIVAAGLVIAAVGAVVLVAAVLAWVALRRRRGPLVAASGVTHVVPVVALTVLGLAGTTGQGLLVLAAALVGVTGITLTASPATRQWMRAD